MADQLIPILELPNGPSPQLEDIVPYVQGGVTKRVIYEKIRDLFFKATGGLLKIGAGTGSNSSNPAINVTRDVSGAQNYHGVSDNSEMNMSVGFAYASFDARINIEGTANQDHYAGFQSICTYNNVGEMSNAYGLVTGGTINAGKITNVYGVYVNNVSKSFGGNAIDNQYGVYVKAQSNGDILNYAVYTEGITPSKFEGSVSVKDLTLAGNGLISSDGSGELDFNYNNGKVGGIYFFGGSTSIKFGADKDGNLLTAGSVETGNPAAGTANPMKFGEPIAVSNPALSGIGIDFQQKIQIGNTVFYALLSTTQQ